MPRLQWWKRREEGEDGYPPRLALCLSVSMGREVFLKCVIAGTITEADRLKRSIYIDLSESRNRKNDHSFVTRQWISKLILSIC